MVTEEREVLDGTKWAGMRLDRALAEYRNEFSRNQVRRLIQDGRVRVNGTMVKPSYRIRPGDRIEVVWSRPAEPGPLEPHSGPVRVLRESAGYLVVYKPAGLVVHPGAGRETDTLVQRLLARYPELGVVGHPRRPGLVHRLDRVTSGIMVVARTPAAYQSLVRHFSAHKVRKEYLAYVWGLPAPRQAEVHTRMARHPVHRKRFHVVSNGGKLALTRYRVVVPGAVWSLVRIRIRTGRTHQIRVHMAHIGHPVVADAVYGRRRPIKKVPPEIEQVVSALQRRNAIALLAYRLSFPEPDSGRIVTFRSPIPRWFRRMRKWVVRA